MRGRLRQRRTLLDRAGQHPGAACRRGRRSGAEDSRWALGPVDDDACRPRWRQNADFAIRGDRWRHDRRAGQRQPGAARGTGTALLSVQFADHAGVGDLAGLRCARRARRCCVLAGIARPSRVRRRVARMPVRCMPVRCMHPRRPLRDLRRCLDLALHGLHTKMAWAAVHHGRSCHPLCGNGQRHKPDQHGPEQLPHAATLQQLPFGLRAATQLSAGT